MKTKAPLDYELEKTYLGRKLDFCKAGVLILCVVIMLLSAMLYFCRSAHAGGFVEIGKSNFIRPAEFIWWQGPYPHEFRMDSGYFRIGYEKGPWRVSWFDLDHYSTDALATPEEVRLLVGGCNKDICQAPDRYQTAGSVRGILFSYVYRNGGAFVEGGPSITRQKFQLRIDGPSGYSVLPESHFNGSTTAIGYMASVGFEYKRFTVSFAYWLNGKASEFYAAGNTPGIDTVKTFAVGYRF